MANKLPDIGSTFGNRQIPRREPQRVEVEVQVEVPVPFKYDENIDGYWVGNFGITSYGIWVGEEADQNEWMDASRAISQVEKGSDWGKADLARFALQSLELDREYVAGYLGFGNIKSLDIYVDVSELVQDRQVRLAAPSFSHARWVKNMPSIQQLRWMENARSQKWSVSELRRQLDIAAGVVDKPPSKIGAKKAAALLKNHKKQADHIFDQAKRLPQEQRFEMSEYLRHLASELDDAK